MVEAMASENVEDICEFRSQFPLFPLDKHSTSTTSGFLAILSVCSSFLQHSKRERKQL